MRAIPVLVGGAVVPKSSQLPNQLSSLVRRNAFEISDIRFHSDVDKLIQALEKTISDQKSSVSTESPNTSNPEITSSSYGEYTKPVDATETDSIPLEKNKMHIEATENDFISINSSKNILLQIRENFYFSLIFWSGIGEVVPLNCTT